MRDYTVNNYCDFLWVDKLLNLKRDTFKYNVQTVKNKKEIDISISNVIIFGTIIEVKRIGGKEFLYYIDDGTGVIACKHSAQQFEETINLIENEQFDMLNYSLDREQEGSYLRDMSVDDSVFNDRSMQIEEADSNNKSRLKCLQSIWNDINASFVCLIDTYNVGDTVLIQGKLYTYFNMNQIYINNIKIMLLTLKLGSKMDSSECKSESKNRLSGLFTFDNIQYSNNKLVVPRNIKTPEIKSEVLNPASKVVTPNLEVTITFDTFCHEV